MSNEVPPEVQKILDDTKEKPCTCGSVNFLASFQQRTEAIWNLDLPESKECPNYLEGCIHRATAYCGSKCVCMVCFCRGEYVNNYRTLKRE